uniref:conglutin delta 3-like n=1 Tax=Erigeron canadensis TaxID=72917 RepID=UPI001CB949B5|nr:conglutin delta 3-like [Erigeron canadensis]
MAKLIVLAVAFTVLVAIASARKTVVVTTTIDDDDPSSQKQQQYCSPKLRQKSFDQCQMYLDQQADEKQDQDLIRQQCCSELQKVDDQQCQCVAVKQVLKDFLQSQQQKRVEQGEGLFGFQQIERFKQKAQNLPNQCIIQKSQQECKIGTISTTTIITEDPYNHPSIISTRGGSEQM